MPTYIEKDRYEGMVNSIRESMLQSFRIGAQETGASVVDLQATDLARHLDDHIRLALGEACDTWPATLETDPSPPPSGTCQNAPKFAQGRAVELTPLLG